MDSVKPESEVLSEFVRKGVEYEQLQQRLTDALCKRFGVLMFRYHRGNRWMWNLEDGTQMGTHDSLGEMLIAIIDYLMSEKKSPDLSDIPQFPTANTPN